MENMWIIAIASVSTIFFLEHFGRIYELAWRPSAFIKVFVSLSEKTWELAGRSLAHISGLVEWVYEFIKKHFSSLGETLAVFFNLFVRAVEAPAHFVLGYAAVLRTYMNQTMVCIGSLALATLVVGLLVTHKEAIVERYQNVISTTEGFWAVHLTALWMGIRLLVILISALNSMVVCPKPTPKVVRTARRPVQTTFAGDILEELNRAGDVLKELNQNNVNGVTENVANEEKGRRPRRSN